MSGSDKFLTSYLRALFRLAYGWIYSFWISITKRCSLNTIKEDPFEIKLSSAALTKTKFKKECDNDQRDSGVKFKPYKNIPTAKGWPLIGTTLDLIAAGSAPNLHKYIDRRHQEFGHIFRERLGSQEAVFVSSAKLMRSVFLYEGQYPTHPLPDSWVLYNKLHSCQRGLFFMDGPEWQANRRIMNRFLLNGNLEWMNLHIESCTERLTECWKASVNHCRDEDKINGYTILDNLEGQLYRWSIDVIGSIMFGFGKHNVSKNLNETIDVFSRNVQKIFEHSSHLMTFPPKVARALKLKIWKQFEKDVTKVLQMGYELFEMYMKENDDTDDDTLFVKMHNAGMSIDIITRIFIDLIIAAGDTTAFSSQWVLYNLSKSKELQRKLQIETLLDSRKSELARGLIRETLRLYPVAPFIGRYLVSDAVIGDYEVKKNTLVLLSLYTSGRDPNHFPDPLAVKPERWLRDPSTGQLNGVLQAHGTIPFAIGNRSCIGRKIALIEMQYLIWMITQNFDIAYLNEEPVDIILRLVAVPNPPLKLGIKFIDE